MQSSKTETSELINEIDSSFVHHLNWETDWHKKSKNVVDFLIIWLKKRRDQEVGIKRKQIYMQV